MSVARRVTRLLLLLLLFVYYYYVFFLLREFGHDKSGPIACELNVDSQNNSTPRLLHNSKWGRFLYSDMIYIQF